MMGCGASNVKNVEEINLIHRVCLMIENKNPTVETVWQTLKDLQNRGRLRWNGCWSTPLGKTDKLICKF
jgi:hypothetical protein